MQISKSNGNDIPAGGGHLRLQSVDSMEGGEELKPVTGEILIGDVRKQLRTLPERSVHCVVTSPPYWSLRDYGVAGQLGLEASPEEYVAAMVEVFAEVWRVLRNDGTLWLNLGDSYAHNGACGGGSPVDQRKPEYGRKGVDSDKFGGRAQDAKSQKEMNYRVPAGLKPKDLVGIPWRLAFALQDAGWYLRQDIIWCLSGGTYIYVRTQKGDMPMMLRDAARLDPRSVKLWNGEKWTQVRGWSRTSRAADELEIVLRSGERISCTPTHQFPTKRGLLLASEIIVGDTIQRVLLPEPDEVKAPVHISNDAEWLAGLYLAEGSMSGDKIQISGNASEIERFERVSKIAADYGGSATCTIDGNNQIIRIYGRMIVAIIRELVSGKTAKDKCLSPTCWRYGNEFLLSYLDGYLSGDGHYDEKNNRWRLGFTRNYNLERDLRTLSARIGFHLVLSPVFVDGFGNRWPAFKGEIRFSRSGHCNEKDTGEVVEIRRSRCREVYDVGVEDEPHLFALASGVLTHNSKPSPMPESVRDRCTKSHEYIFLLTKAERYFYDAVAIQEKTAGTAHSRRGVGSPCSAGVNPKAIGKKFGTKQNASFSAAVTDVVEHRNARSVWRISSTGFPGAHFATFPPALPERCIKAGTSERGCCPTCGAPWKRLTEKQRVPTRSGNTSKVYVDPVGSPFEQHSGDIVGNRDPFRHVTRTVTTGWQPTCVCHGYLETREVHDFLDGSGEAFIRKYRVYVPNADQPEPIPCTVLDPFLGSGTTALMAEHLGRNWLGCELNPDYAEIAKARIAGGYRPPKTKGPPRRKRNRKERLLF